MKTVIPLFNFYLISDRDYTFKCHDYKIRKFQSESDSINSELFSQQDIYDMQSAFWTIEAKTKRNLTEEINLILISIKIFYKISPYTKYHICKENLDKCKRMTEFQSSTMTESHEPIEYEDLKIIDQGFESLKEMLSISNRTHNALYFLYRGFYSSRWLDSYIFLVCVLEALFSKNSPGSATKTISKRVAKFLDYKFTESRIEKMYCLRSDIIHGRIKSDPNPKENIKKLSELEELVIILMRKFLLEEIYLSFNSDESRSEYFNILMSETA